MRRYKLWVLLGAVMLLSLLVGACAPASIPESPTPPSQTPIHTPKSVPIPPPTLPPSLEKKEYQRVYPETIRGFWMPALAGYRGKRAHSVDEPETIKEFHANLVTFAAHLGYDHEGEIDLSRFEKQLPVVRSLIKEYHRNNISVFLTIEVLGPERSQDGGPLSIPESVSMNDEFISGYDRCLEKVVTLAEEEKVEYFAPMNEPDYKLGSEIGNVWSRRMLQIVQKGFTGKIVYKGSLYPIHWEGKQLDVSGYSYVGLTSAPFNGKLEEYRPSLSERLQTLIEWSREDKFELMITEFGISGLGQDIPEEKEAEALTAVFEEGRKYGIKTYIVSDLPGAKIKGTALEKIVKEYFLWLEQNESTAQVGPEAGPSDCDLVFTFSPLDIDHILSIVPLGNLNPPGHTFPTDHIYFHITRREGADRADIATLYSPGELTITGVSASEHVKAGFTDYTIFLKPCDDITVMFYHASYLSQDIFGDTSSFDGWKRGSEYTTGGETYRSWRKEYHIKVKAGDILGTVGGNLGQWALDLGVYDQRHNPEMVANPKRWSQYRYHHTVCPLNFYKEGPVLDQLWKLVERDKMEGDSTPCGSILHDIPGTAQGCWFLSGIKETYPEDPHLALVYSNVHPSHAVLSVGNSIPNLDSGTYEFLPRDSGLLNRNFQDIIPGERIYGFEVDQFDGIVILQMPDAETLWIEAIKDANNDPTSWIFTENKIVFNR